MLALISFIILCIAFVAGPLLIVIGGSQIIREDERIHDSVVDCKEVNVQL